MSNENKPLREYEVHVIRELMVCHHVHASSCEQAAMKGLNTDPRKGDVYADLVVSVFQSGVSTAVTYDIYPDGRFEERGSAKQTAKD